MSSAFFGSIVVAKQMSYEQDISLSSPPVSPAASNFGSQNPAEGTAASLFRTLKPGGAFPLGRSLSNPVNSS